MAAAAPRAKSRRAKIGLVLLASVLAVVVFETGLAVLPRTLVPSAFRTIETFYTRRAEWRALTAGRPLPRVQAPARRRGAVLLRGRSHPHPDHQPRPRSDRVPRHRNAGRPSAPSSSAIRSRSATRSWRRTAGSATCPRPAACRWPPSASAATRPWPRPGSSSVMGPAFGAPLVLVGIFPNDLADNVNFDKWARGGTDDLALVAGARARTASRRAAGSRSTRRCTAYSVRPCTRAARKIHRHREGDLDLVLRFDDWWMESSPIRSGIPAGP